MIKNVDFCTQTFVQPKTLPFKGTKNILSNKSAFGNKLQNQLTFLGAQNKLHFNTINFTSHDNASFDEFGKAKEKAGIRTIKDLTANIKEENLLGTGLNSRVYKFDDEALNNWALKEDKEPFCNPCHGDEYRVLEDEFDGINMGQEIARTGERYHILKKINGKPHSVDNWSAHINNDGKISKAEAENFSDSIRRISGFEQSTFDDYARQLSLIGKKGYKQDSINPNNLMIDYKNKKIQIIDFFKVDDPSHVNSRLDLCNALLDFSLLNNIYDKLNDTDKQEFIKNAQAIVDKCSIASKKYGIPQDEQTYINYLANVDKWFGFKLADKGGDYRTRYYNLKSLIPGISKG